MKFHFLNEGTFQGGGEWNSIIIFVGAGEGEQVKMIWVNITREVLIPRGHYASSNTDIFRELLANNTTHFSRVYIKQYWHYHWVLYKLNYSKRFFRVHVTLISESYCQKILTYSELISKIIHTFKVSMYTWRDK